jgi:hypothetical protein
MSGRLRVPAFVSATWCDVSGPFSGSLSTVAESAKRLQVRVAQPHRIIATVWNPMVNDYRPLRAARGSAAFAKRVQRNVAVSQSPPTRTVAPGRARAALAHVSELMRLLVTLATALPPGEQRATAR